MSLPILSAQFFDQHTPDLGFFSKWRDLYQWNDQILPIYEWKSVLYVACLQPPKSFPKTSQKIVFVLCDHETLKRVFYDYEGTVVIEREPSLDVQVPGKLQVSPAPQSESENSDDLKLDFSLDATPETPAEISESDLKLDFNGLENSEPALELAVSEEEVEIPNLDLASEDSLTIEADPALPAAMDATESAIAAAPAGAPEDEIAALLQDDAPSEEVSAEESPKEESTNSGLLDLNGGAPDAAPTVAASAPSPLVALQPLGDSPVAKPAETAPPVTAPAASASTAPVKNEDLTPLDAGSFTANAIASAQKRATPASSEALMKSEVTRIAVNALNSVAVEKMDPWMEKLFGELDKHYQKAMILVKSGDQVKPWKWNAGFQPATPSITSVTLLQPSPFRIVHRTHKPYHGYVVANDLNDKFFAQWNGSQVPEHMTIAPVMVEDHVIGMLLAIGEKSADTKACLHLMESRANKI